MLFCMNSNLELKNSGQEYHCPSVKIAFQRRKCSFQSIQFCAASHKIHFSFLIGLFSFLFFFSLIVKSPLVPPVGKSVFIGFIPNDFFTFSSEDVELLHFLVALQSYTVHQPHLTLQCTILLHHCCFSLSIFSSLPFLFSSFLSSSYPHPLFPPQLLRHFFLLVIMLFAPSQ